MRIVRPLFCGGHRLVAISKSRCRAPIRRHNGRSTRETTARPERRTIMSKPTDKIYTESEIEAKLRELGLTGWYLEDGWLRRKFTTDGWPTTLMLTNAIGYL